MKINEFDYKTAKPSMMVYISRHEALLLIKSLANQLISEDGNSGRLETFTEDGRYFSLFIKEDTNEKEKS